MPLACYAVVRADHHAPAVPGIAGSRVETLVDGPIAVLVSSVPDTGAAADTGALADHAAVVEAAFADGPVLPLRFPTLAASAQEVVTRLLSRHGARLASRLSRVDGSVELRVRARYHEEAVVRQVVEDSPTLQVMIGRADLAAQLGEAVLSGIRARADRDSHALLAHLRTRAADISVDELAGQLEVLRASALVAADGAETLAAQLEAAATEMPALQLRVLWPLPPYSFVDGQVV